MNHLNVSSRTVRFALAFGLFTAALAFAADSPAAPSALKTIGKGTYGLIKVEGEIGAQFNDELLKKCLEQIEKLGIRKVILEVNSDGGLVVEEQKILRTLVEWQESKKIPITAYVRQRAYSAAAMITLGCREIYMNDAATIGAATAVSVGSGARISAVDEKFASARRATLRALVDKAGHDGRIAEAMVDMRLELWLSTEGGKISLLTGEEHQALRDKKADYKKIDPSNKLLAMTAREAKECGLVKGFAADTAAALAAIGGAGMEPDPTVAALVTRRAAAVKSVLEDYDRQIRTLKFAIDQVKDKSKTRKPLTRTELQNAQAACTRVIRLRSENLWLASRISRDFSSPPEKLLDSLRNAEQSLKK